MRFAKWLVVLSLVLYCGLSFSWNNPLLATIALFTVCLVSALGIILYWPWSKYITYIFSVTICAQLVYMNYYYYWHLGMPLQTHSTLATFLANIPGIMLVCWCAGISRFSYLYFRTPRIKEPDTITDRK